MTTAIVTPTDKLWLSNPEAQRYLGMKAGWFKNLRATGALPFYKIGGAVFYRKRDLDRLVERGRVT